MCFSKLIPPIGLGLASSQPLIPFYAQYRLLIGDVEEEGEYHTWGLTCGDGVGWLGRLCWILEGGTNMLVSVL